MAVRKVKRRGRAVWRARVVIGGKSATAYRDRRDEAVEAEAGLRQRLKQAQLHPGVPNWGGRVPTLDSFVDAFLTDAEARNGPAELKHKKQHLRDHLLEVFGALRLDQINTQLVDAFAAEKLQTLTPSTVTKLTATLRRALNVARDWGIIDRVPKFRTIRVRQGEVDFLEFEEAERFVASSGAWRPFVVVAIRTGLRLGELRGLQWGDVDLERRRIRVARAFTQSGWGTPKSGRGRTVDLAQDAVDALTSLRPRRASRTDLVFPGPSGGPLGEKAVYKACVTASEAAGLGRVVGPHKLRHTFASHHAMRGTPLPVIQSWMGHADITTPMRYAHLAPTIGAKYIDAVSSAADFRRRSAKASLNGAEGRT